MHGYLMNSRARMQADLQSWPNPGDIILPLLPSVQWLWPILPAIFFFSFFRYMAEDNYSIAWVSACSRLEKDCTYCIPKYAVVDPAWLYWLWWWWGRGGVPWYLLKWLPAPTSVGEEEGSWGMGCVSKIYTTTNRTEQHLPNEWMTWDSVFFNFKAHDFSNTSCSLQTFASEITVSITSVKEKGLV